ncbi:MAG: glutamate-1-semialdehyde 2,1-aminomutase [Chitinivibrionales bacterium]|nr:glutamate-1-semialdehyde 2,1-aminomutase [Chitinivibrionales bacterium]
MTTSKELFARAIQSIPGGVNSPVRAFKSVNSDLLFIRKASGSRIYDCDGAGYIDLVMSWGPLILGHAHPVIVNAVCKAAESGTSFGAPTEKEIELAEMICSMVPGIEKVRLVNSGTEATMSAVRLARGVTGRDKIIKFEGCYHGHGDSFLVKAGSGALTFGEPTSPGVTKGTAQDTLVAAYNDLQSVQALFDRHPDEIACVIVEPVAGNMGVIVPDDGFLPGLRRITEDNGALLVFDEVISGFRISPGGAQEYYSVTPDLTTLGKIIGGGLPVGAYGGKASIMDCLAPDGPVYQAGTLSGNPLAVAAGIAMLDTLKKENPYASLEIKSQKLADGLRNIARNAGVDVCINAVASMMCMFFTKGPVRSYENAVKADTGRFARYHKKMLDQGIYCAPSQFEASFISTAHSGSDLDAILSAARKAMNYF